MNIVVKGRNVEVPDHYRVHVTEKLAHVERYDQKAVHYDVELFHERNPRQSKSCQRVEITGRCRGQVVRAEACGSDFYAALDAAISKLDNRLRRVADRHKVHYGRRHPTSVAEATAPLAATLAPQMNRLPAGTGAQTNSYRAQVDVLEAPDHELDYELPTQRRQSDDGPSPDDQSSDTHGPGRVVRRKRHSATPMTVDDALYEMELVGHDFFLFSDADSGLPSVVYRRRGFDYGVIQLV
ncbi:MAG TPA: ribosome-associated translation inhibitor RaiA [Pseudonocardiaceae bacterium]|nr:ribosome-associated translation inhibitor RaiA [Pseudonocardiaceae bacterium]